MRVNRLRPYLIQQLFIISIIIFTIIITVIIIITAVSISIIIVIIIIIIDVSLSSFQVNLMLVARSGYKEWHEAIFGRENNAKLLSIPEDKLKSFCIVLF